MSPRTPAAKCICGFHHRHDCPAPGHGLKSAAAKVARPSTRRPLAPASETRKEEKKEWALIKRTLIVAQKRYRGHTFCEATDHPVKASELDCDHIIPSGDGGPWKPGNAQLLCRPHHDLKHGNQPKWTKKRASK